MTSRSPKDILSAQELIGFKRPAKGGDQVPRRASSTKVTAVEPSPREVPVESEGSAAPTGKSRA